MDHETLADAAAVVGAFGAAGLLLARGRAELLAAVVLLAAAELGLAYALVPDAPGRLTDSATHAGALAVAGLAALVLAAGFVRLPAAAPVALLVAAPFRVSVGLGSENAFLLVAFYAVLVSATLAVVYQAVQRPDVQRIPTIIAAPAAALVALAGLSLLWAHDPRAGTIELLFFYFPFALLLAIVARTPIQDWSWRALAAALVSVTSIFAAIGVYQAWSHIEILAKQDVQLANAYQPFFRVTSVFQDPSVYGRHLVLGIAVLLTLLWYARVRPTLGLLVLALLAAGLYFSYSQTSFASLFVAVLLITLVAGGMLARKFVVGAAGAIIVAAAALVMVFGDGDSAKRLTSDRIPLAQVTWPVYLDHPLVGVGVGSQPLVSHRQEDAKNQKSKNVSHTTPLAMAAELGTVGLLVYLAFLAALARAILSVWRRNRPLALSLAACLTALVVQSLFYGGFFEDPFVWGIAGVTAAACSLLPQRVAGPLRHEPPVAARAEPLPVPRRPDSAT